jgi:serine/threonine protein kinase
MSQQQEDADDGTVINPRTIGTSTWAGGASPGPAAITGVSDLAEDGLSLRVGARVSEFEITRRLGDGGFSIVYLAMDHSLERTVALKEYMPSSLATRLGTTQVQPRSDRYRDTFEAGLRSFVNEAKLLAQFDHPALVKVYRFWEANGTAYMVMPFYQGVTVKEAVRAMERPPDEAWLLALLAPLTEALLVIHADHCYHRDIAPDNVILLAGSAKPLLLDFGAARRVIGDMTQALTVILKAGYAPVEQYAEIPGMKQGPWTDVYALGAVVYWAITGKTPPASVGRMMGDTCVPLAERAAGQYSAGFLQAIDRALAVMPDKRTPSITAFRQDLGLGAQPSPAQPRTQVWADTDATVIRPVGSTPGPAAGRGFSAADVLEPGHFTPRTSLAPAAPPEVPVASGAEPASRFPTTASAPARDLPVASEREGVRRSRRAPLVAAAAIGAVAVAAGIWWSVQKPAPSPVAVPVAKEAGSPKTERPATATSADVAMPAPSQASLDAPSSPSVPATQRIEPSVPVVADAQTPAASPPPRLPDAVTDTAQARPAKKSSSPDPRARTVEPRPEPSTSRADVAGRRERAPVDAGNAAECGRIFQRLSLGDSSPELIERLKSLKCR